MRYARSAAAASRSFPLIALSAAASTRSRASCGPAVPRISAAVSRSSPLRSRCSARRSRRSDRSSSAGSSVHPQRAGGPRPGDHGRRPHGPSGQKLGRVHRRRDPAPRPHHRDGLQPGRAHRRPGPSRLSGPRPLHARPGNGCGPPRPALAR
jgi:hypothetical protein